MYERSQLSTIQYSHFLFSEDQDALGIISLLLYEIDIRDIFIDFLVLIQENKTTKKEISGRTRRVGGGVTFIFFYY